MLGEGRCISTGAPGEIQLSRNTSHQLDLSVVLEPSQTFAFCISFQRSLYFWPHLLLVDTGLVSHLFLLSRIFSSQH